MPVEFAIRTWRPASRIVAVGQVALRVTVPPVEVTYAISSPARSTAADPALVSSANSSDAEAPPVTISDTRSVDVGQATAATSRPAAARPPSSAGGAETVATAMTAISKNRGRVPARRTRSIDDLPAGRAERLRTRSRRTALV